TACRDKVPAQVVASSGFIFLPRPATTWSFQSSEPYGAHWVQCSEGPADRYSHCPDARSPTDSVVGRGGMPIRSHLRERNFKRWRSIPTLQGCECAIGTRHAQGRS